MFAVPLCESTVTQRKVAVFLKKISFTNQKTLFIERMKIVHNFKMKL